MKYIIMAVLSGLFYTRVYAQNGFYLAPSLGVGYSGFFRPLSTLGANGNDTANSRYRAFSCHVQAGIGYRYKHWRFQSGVQFVKNGYKIKNVSFPLSTIAGKLDSYSVNFVQIGVPVQIGYEMSLDNKLSFITYIAGYPCLTLGCRIKDEYNGVVQKSPSTSGTGKSGWFTGWAVFGFQFERKLNGRISAFSGISIQYTLVTTGYKKEANMGNAHFNIGLNADL